MFSTLISAADLASRLERPGCVIIDCRADLTDASAGEAAYLQAHVPGAVFAQLDRDLAGPISATSGRHPLPAVEQFVHKLRSWGVDTGSQVIAYDAGNGAFAARAWWMLRWLGHDAVAVLDGGFQAWLAAGCPVSREIPRPTRGNFTARERAGCRLETGEVARLIGSSDWRIVDARATERFEGVVEPIDAVAGHVPGAVNHPFARNLAGDGRFLPAEELRRALQATLAGVAPDRTVVMCGSGVTACHDILAFEIAGLGGAKLYPGSWSEWIRDPDRPVATGPA